MLHETGSAQEEKARHEGEQAPLPTTHADLLRRFDRLGIAYDLHRHAPFFTVAEGIEIEKNIPGTHCRNLFLCDKKKTMYLVTAANETQICLKKLAKVIGAGRLSFGSADRLWRYLGVRPGSVCPFAVVNNRAGDVNIILDAFMMAQEQVNFHPMENHMTVGLTPGDLLSFIKDCGHRPHIVDLTPARPEEKENEHAGGS